MNRELPQEFRRELDSLASDVSEQKMRETARTLAKVNYSPVFLMDTPGFFSFNRDDLARELERIWNMPKGDLPPLAREEAEDTDEFRRKHMSMLLYHFRHLQKLRRDDPDAWDTVNELSLED